MNSYVAWGIFGIISGLIASFADVPLVMPNQSENLKLGGVCPWWGDVTSKRFKVSFWLSFLGQPGGYIVMWLLADMISNGNVALAGILKVMTLLGCYTGLMRHVVFCLKPLLYQRLCHRSGFQSTNVSGRRGTLAWSCGHCDSSDTYRGASCSKVVRCLKPYRFTDSPHAAQEVRCQDHRSSRIWICAAFSAAHYCRGIKKIVNIVTNNKRDFPVEGSPFLRENKFSKINQ